MSLPEKRTASLDAVNQRRASFPSTGELDTDSSLPTWSITELGGGGGGGGGGGQSNTSKHSEVSAKDPQSSTSSLSVTSSHSAASQSSQPSSLTNKVTSNSVPAPAAQRYSVAHPSHDLAKTHSMYPAGVVQGVQYSPYGGSWNTMPMTTRLFDSSIGYQGYPPHFGSESILDQMYRGTSGSLNLVSLGLQSVSNFTGVLNQFFMAIQSTLASLMNLTSQMHFIKHQFARALSIFSLYRGLKWLIARLLQALGLKTQGDVETAWREATSGLQTPSYGVPSRRPWRRVLLTTLFITIPTLIIYILDVLNTPVTPPPGRQGGSLNMPTGSTTGATIGTVGTDQGQGPSSQPTIAPGHYSSLRYSAPPNSYSSAQLNSPYGITSPFSSPAYSYTGTASPYGMGEATSWGNYGSPLNNFNMYGNYHGMMNRYNYGSNFNGTGSYASNPMQQVSHGYVGASHMQPGAATQAHQMPFSVQNSVPKSESYSEVNSSSDLKAKAPASEPTS